MTDKKPIIGVLALQGCVERHKPHIEAAGGEFRAVKTPAQFDAVDAFILPGGESTTMLRLIDNFNLWDALEKNFKAKPVWGICAGSILLAEKVMYKTNTSSPRSASADLNSGDPEKDGSKAAGTMDCVRANASDEACQRNDAGWKQQKSFAVVPVTVQRNAYGTQAQSHNDEIEGYEVSFIRAPVIKDVADTVEIKATHRGDPAWVTCGQTMLTTFHPELTMDFPSPMHRAFLDIVKKAQAQKAA